MHAIQKKNLQQIKLHSNYVAVFRFNQNKSTETNEALVSSFSPKLAETIGKLLIINVFVLLMLLFKLLFKLEQPIDGGGGRTGNGNITFDNVKNLFQLILTRLRGGPIGGVCCVARARNASAMRCGWLAIIFFQPDVSITSVG